MRKIELQVKDVEEEMYYHLENDEDHWGRCDGIELDETCADLLKRNPEATSGSYALVSGISVCYIDEEGNSWTELHDQEDVHAIGKGLTVEWEPSREDFDLYLIVDKGNTMINFYRPNKSNWYSDGFNFNLNYFYLKCDQGSDMVINSREWN